MIKNKAAERETISTLSEMRALAKKWLPENNYQKFNLISERIDNDDLPKVIIYGVYNAGKSSLINGLFGQKVAKTGRIPTTDAIHSYKWGDITLIDTPGIDAPIDHEQIAKEALYSADVVVFVIQNSGSFDCYKTAEELVALIKRKIPSIVVLTRRDYMSMGDVEYSQIVTKIQSNIEKAAKELKIDIDIRNFPDLFLVDSVMALEGKEKNDSELLKQSGIRLFADRLEKIAAKCSSAQKTKQALSEISQEITPLVRKAIEQEMVDEKLKELERDRKRIENRKFAFVSRCMEEGRVLIKISANKLRNGEWFGDNLNEQLGEIINKNIKAVFEETGYIATCEKIKNPGINSCSDTEATKYDYSSNMKETALLLSSPRVKKQIEEGIKNLGKMLKAGSKTMAKVRALAGKVLSVIGLALVAVDIILTIKENEEVNEAARQKEYEAENTIRTWELEVEHYFKEVVTKLVEDILAELTSKIKGEMEKLLEDDAALKEALNSLNKLENSIAQLTQVYEAG
ncbi:MAG: GTPase [bacterium]